MKKWYRSTLAKAILTGTAIVSAIILSLNAVLLIGYQGEGNVSPSEIVQFQAQSYEDSAVFASRMQDAIYNVLDEITARKRIETEDGTYDPNRIVDVLKYEENRKITGKNISGLAYTLEELGDWGRQYVSGENKDTDIVVCENTDGMYHYYYLEEFENLLKNGDLQIERIQDEENSHSETTWNGMMIEMLKNGFSSMDYYGENLLIQDSEGKVLYREFWPFQSGIKELKAPQGASNVLEVVNQRPELNGKLEEVFQALEFTLTSVDNDLAVYQEDESIWAEGNTNLQYLMADVDNKKVYTNQSAYADYGKLETSIEAMKALGKYVIVKPKLADFESNMEVSASDWKSLIDGYKGDSEQYVFVAAVDTKYPIQDLFYTGEKEYGKYAPYLASAFVFVILGTVVLLISLVWLTVCAGRRPEDELLHLNGYDRWKTALGAVAVIVPWLAMTWFLGMSWNGIGYQEMSYAEYHFHTGQVYYMFTMTVVDVAIIAIYTGLTAVLFLIGYLSLVRRIKGKTIWKNSVIFWLYQKFKEVWMHRNVCLRTVIVIVCFVAVHWLALITSGNAFFMILTLAVDLLAFYVGVRGAIEKNKIQKGIEKIASGNVDYQIQVEKMHGESREMAELVNTIGDGLNKALEAAVKGERLKTDLITNVSHDIKTPLTSIINYVDLLKREEPEDPKIQGYLEVLEAKAQRLKTLTEDVVEASKVSSGNITLEMMDVNLVEMVNQTIGEMSEKMEAKNLTIVASLPEEPAIVHVDGRRMWRVLENIFNNAAKYAMPGTRVYADLRVKDSGNPEKKRVEFSLKNVSENPLNIDAEELTERFIRGDVSRSTEGSGLGLSIARDLTEMQGGKFKLYVDGDLFKVMIEF